MALTNSDNHAKAKDYLKRLHELDYNELADALTFKWFRLNTMYHIKDKFGRKVLFTPNQEQEDFYVNRHGRDIILKARQLGFTTFKMISDLDDCLFKDNHTAGCIAHNLDDAKAIFSDKIKFAYENITDDQRQLLAEVGYELPIPVNDRDNTYKFNNGSIIKVSVSYRGGTLQSLHVSEFGKICRKFPDKAREIVTGAFEAVGIGNTITIESTAEGKSGYFYDYCREAERLQKLEKTLNALDFNFHFFPWWTRDEYRLDGGDIASQLTEYFDGLQGKHGVKLDDAQKAWYSSKWKVLGDDMKREYPSTPKEAFEQSVEGAYYARQFNKIYADKRICKGFNNDAKVHTAWDIGVGDSTSIWFYQKVGTEIHLIDFYENSGEGLQHYMKVLKDRGYDYGYHYAPHDIDNRSFEAGAKTRREIAAEGFEIDGEHYHLYFEVVPKKSIDDGIEDARQLLDRCVFDEDKCTEGITHLENYKKDWNEQMGTWRDRPRHDEHSHAADAFRYLAVIEQGMKVYVKAPRLG